MSESFESPTTVSSESAPQKAASLETPIFNGDTRTKDSDCARGERLHSSLVVRGLAEFVGTFFIIFVLLGAASWTLLGSGGTVFSTALAAAFAYGAAAFTFGRISGGHFNPAVTLVAALTSKIKWIDALVYCVAQVLGGIAAAALLLPLIPSLPTSTSLTEKSWWGFMVNGFGTNSPIYLNSQVNVDMKFALVVELIGSLVVISAVISAMGANGAPRRNFALTSALAYGAATFITAPIDGASLNPARSTGVALFAQMKGMTASISQLWVFWVAPLLAGAIVGLVLVVSASFKASADNAAAATAFTAVQGPANAGANDAGYTDDAELSEFNAVIETKDADTTAAPASETEASADATDSPEEK
jgi:aquaporin Z